jgi:hypothetical protein
LLDLKIAFPEDSVAPSRDSHFLASIVSLCLLIELVSRWESDLAFFKLSKELILWFFEIPIHLKSLK